MFYFRKISLSSTFFNRLLISGQYPKAWKYADVTPVYKKGDKQIPNNYRPISLLSVVGKTMERSVHKQSIELSQDTSWGPPGLDPRAITLSDLY